MYKKILISIALILLAALVLKIFPSIITGLLTQIINISLSIQNSTQAKFILFSYPSEITIGDTANFTVVLQNTGNLNITSAIEIHVKDSSLNTLNSSYDINYTLAPLEIRNFSSNFTPTATGTYFVIANASYNSTLENRTIEENRSFDVVEVVVPPVVPPPVVPPVVYVPIELIYNLTVTYPKQFNLTQNESFLILIYATNYGNVDLHNLSLFVSVEKIEWEVRPKNISVLSVGSTALFSISVRVPSDTKPKNYILDFNLSSAEISQTGKIIITVYTIEVCPEVERAIRNYALLIDRISMDIGRAESEGANVTLAREYLEKARQSLEKAKGLYELNNCEKAKEELERVKNYLELIVIEIAKVPPKPPFPFLIILLILLIMVLLILFLIYYRKKKRIKRKVRKSKFRPR